MKRIVCGIVGLALFMLLGAAHMPIAHAATANDEINYQGKLFDSGGSPVTNGTYSIQFKLYTVSSGGSPIWSETQNITTDGGLFQVRLGSSVSLASVDWNQDLFLGLTVESDSEMTPRFTIGSVPTAHTLSGALRLTSTLASYLSGNLGIGTTTPSTKLHVRADSNVTTDFPFTITNSANNYGLQVGAYGLSNKTFGAINIDYTMDIGGDLILTTGGNVGIGTTSPAAKLAVYQDTGLAGDILHLRDNTDGMDLALRFDGTQSFQFRSESGGAGNSLLTLNTNGSVGIGTTTPSGKLHVFNAASGATVNSIADELVLEGNTSSGLSILTPTSSSGNIFFGDSGSASRGRITYNHADDDLAFYTSELERVTIASGGDIGIGTSSPESLLHVSSETDGDAGLTLESDTDGSNQADNPFIRFYQNNRLVSAYIGLEGAADQTSSSSIANAFLVGSEGAREIQLINNGQARLTVATSGDIAIGTSTPTAQFHTTGTVRFQNFGAGTLETDANGNVTVSSDERLKDIEDDFALGLDAVRGLNPIQYRWNATSGLETERVHAGFSAQNVMDHIETAVDVDSRGYYTLSDRPILAASVNAIKELDLSLEGIASSSASHEDEDGEKTFVGRFFDRLTNWFADTANGIGSFFADSFKARDTVCIGDTCLNESQLANLIEGNTTQNAEAEQDEIQDIVEDQNTDDDSSDENDNDDTTDEVVGDGTGTTTPETQPSTDDTSSSSDEIIDDREDEDTVDDTDTDTGSGGGGSEGDNMADPQDDSVQGDATEVDGDTTDTEEVEDSPNLGEDGTTDDTDSTNVDEGTDEDTTTQENTDSGESEDSDDGGGPEGSSDNGDTSEDSGSDGGSDGDEGSSEGSDPAPTE